MPYRTKPAGTTCRPGMYLPPVCSHSGSACGVPGAWVSIRGLSSPNALRCTVLTGKVAVGGCDAGVPPRHRPGGSR